MTEEVPDWAKPRKNSEWCRDWVLWEDGVDDGGNFIGWCPLCDPQRERDGSAEFNFSKGVFRCTNKCAHLNKRAMSIDNLRIAVLEAGR